jgi:hypothetical protein
MRNLTAAALLVLAAVLFLDRPGSSADVEAGTALRMDIPGLVEYTELILEGRVLSTHSLRGADGRIETEYLLSVERTFEGEDLGYRAIRLPGGVLEDGSGMILAGMPWIEAGEDLLLFLTEEAASGIRMPVGLAQGQFQVMTDHSGNKSLLRDDDGVGFVHPGTGEMSESDGVTVRDYAAVVAEIEAALAGKRSR